jgi:putative FmdB family regulatory protein
LALDPVECQRSPPVPTYEYRCKSCGHGLEVVQSFTDEALTKCPNCKKKQLKKVFGSIGITFKGSGFYKTDSRSGSSSSATSTSDSGGDSTSTTTETKADTKADKADAKPAKAERKADPKASTTTS